jgi:hypothetical protein
MAEDERPREVTRLTPDEANIRLDAGGMTLIDVGEESQLRFQAHGTFLTMRSVERHAGKPILRLQINMRGSS